MRWKDYERQVKHCREIGKLSSKKFKKGDARAIEARKLRSPTPKEKLAEMGRRSRLHENMVAKQLQKDFEHLFLPNEVCDRIGVKDGKLFFIEIKQNGCRLTEKQQTFQSLVPNYLVIT